MHSFVKKIFLYAILCTPLLAHAKNFTITSGTQEFATLATAVGDFSISRPFLIINLKNIVIRRNEKRNDNGRVLGFKVGIASNKTGRWKVERWGEKKNLDYLLTPGDSLNISDFQTFIAIDGLSDLSGYWFVIRVDIKSSKTIGYTYSHSERDLLYNKE